MNTVAITTLGCKVNQFESASFASSFIEAGCELVPFSSKADIYVINTCTVTARAAQQSRQLIRKAMRMNPEARLVITGCYSQMAPYEVVTIAGPNICIIGNGYKHLLVETALKKEHPDLVMLIGKIMTQQNICHLPVRRFIGRTRAYLRIQDGCNNFCSYCIVPYTRGPARSLDIDLVLQQAEIFAEEGYREVVITGINVGKYGLDLQGAYTISSLLDTLCTHLPDMRFRLSSIEPTEINDDVIDLFIRHNNLMPHLHIPLQSGDDEVLRKMYRQYTVEKFRTIITDIHKALPDAAIGCDLLGGFPGETEQQAENTFALLKDLPITYLHVFPYSKRPGTLAATVKDQVTKAVKASRVKRLRELDGQLRLQFYEKNLGAERQVLVERRDQKNNLLQGFSDNYIPVHFAGPDPLIHQTIRVRIDGVDNGQALGTVNEQDLTGVQE